MCNCDIIITGRQMDIFHFVNIFLHYSDIKQVQFISMISYIYNKNEKILYTETTLAVSENSYIYPVVCVVRILDGSGIWQIGHELCPIKSGDLIFLSNVEPRRIVSCDGNIKIATFSFNASLITSVGAEECLRVFYGRSSEFTHAIAAPELTVIYDNIPEYMTCYRPARSIVCSIVMVH